MIWVINSIPWVRCASGNVFFIKFINPKAKNSPLNRNHVAFTSTTGKSCHWKRVALSQIISRDEPFGECLYSKKLIFGRFSTFWQNAKTAVSPQFGPGPGSHSNHIIFLVIPMIWPSFIQFGPRLGVLSLLERPPAKMPFSGPEVTKTAVTRKRKVEKDFPMCQNVANGKG